MGNSKVAKGNEWREWNEMGCEIERKEVGASVFSVDGCNRISRIGIVQ